jgi:hypothetical protein
MVASLQGVAGWRNAIKGTIESSLVRRHFDCHNHPLLTKVSIYHDWIDVSRGGRMLLSSRRIPRGRTIVSRPMRHHDHPELLPCTLCKSIFPLSKRGYHTGSKFSNHGLSNPPGMRQCTFTGFQLTLWGCKRKVDSPYQRYLPSAGLWRECQDSKRALRTHEVAVVRLGSCFYLNQV